MKTLLIMLLVFGVLGILMVAGIIILCAWEFYQGKPSDKTINRLD
jgi:hypothetical protein